MNSFTGSFLLPVPPRTLPSSGPSVVQPSARSAPPRPAPPSPPLTFALLPGRCTE